MFILSHSYLSMESKKLFNNSCKAHQPKGGDEKKSHLVTNVFLSHHKQCMDSKNVFYKSVKAHQPREGYEIIVKSMESFGHKCSFYFHNLN